MLFWSMMALMTAAATLIVLRPLLRPPIETAGQAAERAVFRDQLAELERDRQRGLIGAGEAEAARAEIARRLIDRRLVGTDGNDPAAPPRRPLVLPAAVAIVVAVPAVVLGVYLDLGRPELSDAPLAARLEARPEESDIGAMVARVEKHLETHPEDVSGWRVLAPIYMRSGRYAEAAAAYRKLVVAGERDAEIVEAFGLALVAEAGGVATAEAEAVFKGLVAAHPDRPSARFYLAEALRQAGKSEAALGEIDAAFGVSPADAPWLEALRLKRGDLLTALKRPADTPEPATLPAAGATRPGPTAADVAASADMSEADRADMVAGMLDRLKARLEADPKDRDGWLMLIRSLKVTGDEAGAVAAADKARAAFAGDAAALAAIDAAAASGGQP